MSSLVNFYREIEKSKREPKELKCVICKKDILDDSQFINGKYYHNSCIENLIKQNTELKDNWNKLKEWLEEKLRDIQYELNDIETPEVIQMMNLSKAQVLDNVLDKMQEIEGGMNE